MTTTTELDALLAEEILNALPLEQRMLQKYLDAELAILEGKEIKFNDRTLRMEDLEAIRNGRKEWEAKVAAKSAQSVKSAPAIGGRGFSLARFN